VVLFFVLSGRKGHTGADLLLHPGLQEVIHDQFTFFKEWTKSSIPALYLIRLVSSTT
jgi:hypothetical protein